MKKILFSLLLCLFCVSITAAEYMKVGDIKTFDIGYIDHLKGCVWTISRPSNVSFVSTPGAYDTKVQVRATKEFSGDPCIVQCKYYWLEKDPIKGTYTYQRSSYKKWSIFINKSGNDGNSGGETGGTTPNNPEDKRIKLYLCKNGKVDYSQEVTEMTVEEGESLNFWTGICYGPHIYFRIDDTSIANIDENKYILDGVSAGTTWFHAYDAGGGWANCKIIVTKRNYKDGDNMKYPTDRAPQMFFRVTNAQKNECELSGINEDYKPVNGEITIPSKVFGFNVVRIDKVGYRKLKNVKKIHLPNSVKEIGDNAFQNASELEDIELPYSLERIGKYAFSGLTFKSIIIPEGVSYIGEGCFWQCQKLYNVSLPGSLEIVPDNCFTYCYGLRNVILSEGIKKIGFAAFQNSGIASIVIPASMERICKQALKSISLVEITCFGEKPCALDNDAIWENLTLYVPIKSIEQYKHAEEWKNISKIRAIGDKEKVLYVLIPSWRNTSFNSEAGKIPYTKNSYEAKIKTYTGDRNKFSIAKLVGSDFVEYGTISNEAIFSDSEIKNGQAVKKYRLYPMNNNNVHKFLLPKDWQGDSIQVRIDGDINWITFEYGSKESNIEKVSLPDNRSVLLGKNDTLSINITPLDAQISSIEWFSRNENIAKIKNGVIQALDFGETSVYCIVNGNIVSNDCKVIITHSPYLYCGDLNSWSSEKLIRFRYDKDKQVYYMRVSSGLAMMINSFIIIDHCAYISSGNFWSSAYGDAGSNASTGILLKGSHVPIVTGRKMTGYDIVIYPSSMTYEIKPIETSGINGGLIAIKDNVSILLGRKETLKISASTNDAQISSIEWYSRNEDIATVKDGVVTALKFGETSIYCVVNGNIVSNDCKVTITNSPYYYSGRNNDWTSKPITPLEYDKARQAYVLRIPTGDNFKVIDYELFLEKDDWWLASYGPKTENVLSGPLEWCSASCFVVPEDTKEHEFILYPSTMTYEIKPIETSGINDVLMDVKDKMRIFSIEGLELRKPQKGLNIINGKKIIIK